MGFCTLYCVCVCVCVPVLPLCVYTYGCAPLGAIRERPGGLNGAVELKKKKAEKNIHKAILLE